MKTSEGLRARMRLALAFTLLSLVAPVGTNVLASAGSHVTIPWSLDRCFFAYGQTPVDAVRLAPYLPEGFYPAPLAAQTTNALGQAALFGFEVDVCESGEGLSGPVAGMQYASFWASVNPPPALRIPGITSYFVNWDVLVPDAPRREALAATGIPARDGAIAVDAPIASPANGAFTARYQLDGLGELTLEAFGASVPDQDPAPGKFVQWTQGDGQLVRWRTDYDATDARHAIGIEHVPAGSWLADLFGGTSVPVSVNYGAWSYTSGAIDYDS